MNAPLPLAAWLGRGGDDRIAMDPGGANAYGCPPHPVAGGLVFASCTASPPSPRAFAAAGDLHRRLGLDHAAGLSPQRYASELERLRSELTLQLGLAGLPGLGIIFGASGTDLHLFAAQLGDDGTAPLRVFMPEAAETGGGIPAALAGRHARPRAAQAGAVTLGSPIGGGRVQAVVALALRGPDGRPRPPDAVDDELERGVLATVGQGWRALVVLADQSKTGLVGPDPSVALALQRRFPGRVELLVDACQGRLRPASLRRHLSQGLLVALTGSKFMGGPAFSGALLVPGPAARRLSRHALPAGLADYSGRADWPPDWPGAAALPPAANPGLLLRWEAALAEWGALRALDETALRAALAPAADAIAARLRTDPALEALEVPARPPDPEAPGADWDRVQTVFPFLARRRGAALPPQEAARLWRDLGASGCRLGQPITCARPDGEPASALRLSLGLPHALEALNPLGQGPAALVTDAMRALDRVVETLNRPS